MSDSKESVNLQLAEALRDTELAYWDYRGIIHNGFMAAAELMKSYRDQNEHIDDHKDEIVERFMDLIRVSDVSAYDRFQHNFSVMGQTIGELCVVTFKPDNTRSALGRVSSDSARLGFDLRILSAGIEPVQMGLGIEPVFSAMTSVEATGEIFVKAPDGIKFHAAPEVGSRVMTIPWGIVDSVSLA